MSMENPGINKDIIPNEGGDNTKFDAQGNPRTLQRLPDGTYVNLSDAEYSEERKAYDESNGNHHN